MPNSNPACGGIPQDCSNLNISELGSMFPKICVTGNFGTGSGIESLDFEYYPDNRAWEASVGGDPVFIACGGNENTWIFETPESTVSSTGGAFPNITFPGFSTSGGAC